MYSSMLPFAAEDFQISWRVTDIKKFLAPLPSSTLCKMNVFFKKMERHSWTDAVGQVQMRSVNARGQHPEEARLFMRLQNL